MKKYKSFRLQFIECGKNGTRKEEDCVRCGSPLIMCLKYGGLCISSKCLKDRTITPNLTRRKK